MTPQQQLANDIKKAFQDYFASTDGKDFPDIDINHREVTEMHHAEKRYQVESVTVTTTQETKA